MGKTRGLGWHFVLCNCPTKMSPYRRFDSLYYLFFSQIQCMVICLNVTLQIDQGILVCILTFIHNQADCKFYVAYYTFFYYFTGKTSQSSSSKNEIFHLKRVSTNVTVINPYLLKWVHFLNHHFQNSNIYTGILHSYTFRIKYIIEKFT